MGHRIELRFGDGGVRTIKTDCDCYARQLSPLTQFTMHYGAHNPTCPVFKISRDPVDAKWDIEFRVQHETGSLIGGDFKRCTCCD